MADINKPCVYLFPISAPGHLISMVEAAKNLLQCNSISSNSFSIHIILMPSNDPHKRSPLIHSYLQSVEAENFPIHLHLLPFVEPPKIFDSGEEFITLHIRLYLPHIKDALLASPSPVSGLIIDMFATDVIDVANQLNVPTYVYYSTTATFFCLSYHLSSLQAINDQKSFSEVEEDICVPGLMPIPSVSIPNSLMDMKSAAFKATVNNARRCMEAKGVIVNSNIYIETKAVQALANGVITQVTPGRTFPEIYPIGPVISLRQNSTQEDKCLEWLDKQPEKSVVFLCFGNMGAFEPSQVRQITAGLEQSGQRFLWILRTPPKEFISIPSDVNLEELLPGRFLERTNERGMVWPSWIPQTEILSHRSIGGFVTHCGWNSVLESLWFGVPMIPWPLHAEQHLNAFLLLNELHVAVELKFDRKNNGFVSAMDLERAIKQLMEVESEEGRRVRDRVEEVKSACRKAVEREGVSYVHLQKLAEELGKVPNAQPGMSGYISNHQSS